MTTPTELQLSPLADGDVYDTPDGQPRWLGDRLALSSRFYFIARYLGIVAWASWLVRRGATESSTWGRGSQAVLRLIEGCGGRVHIRGLDNLRRFCHQGPFVFVSNHMSSLETNVTPGLILPFMQVTFVVKDSLMRYPMLGRIMQAMDAIPVARQNPRDDFQTVMREGIERLKRGISVIIYPQSTRELHFDPDRFNTLGVKLARQAGVPVMPICVRTDFWANGRLLRDFGPLQRNRPVHFAFGVPLAVQGTGREAHRQVIDFMVRHLGAWGLTSTPA